MRKYTFIVIMLAWLPFFCKGQSVLSLTIAGYDAKCNGSHNGSAKATLSGGVGPYAYVWAPPVGTSDSVSGLAAGVYSVTVTDSLGHTISGSVTISQPAPLIVNIDSIVVPSCADAPGGACGCGNTLWAVVSGGTPPYSYLWIPDSATTDTLFYACYLEFTVNVTDSNNCLVSDSLNVVLPTPINIGIAGVGQISNTNNISIYPNPAKNELNISVDKSVPGISSIAVYDLMGEKVFEQAPGINERHVNIDVSAFADGSYLLKVISGKSQQTTRFSISR